MTRRRNDPGVDRVYRVADLVADLAAGRATPRADDPAPVAAPEGPSVASGPAPPPTSASAAPPRDGPAAPPPDSPAAAAGGAPRPDVASGPTPRLRTRAPDPPNAPPEPAPSSWAADPPTPPSGAPLNSLFAASPRRRATQPPASGVPHLPPRPEARPRIVEDPAILGLSRVSRSRLGSRLFTWFFVFVYLVIVIQLIWSILQG